jgi:hypothetical protein
VNGAVEFTREYEISGDVFAGVAWELSRAVDDARERNGVLLAAAA